MLVGQSSTGPVDVVTVILLVEQLESRFTLLKENSMIELRFTPVSDTVHSKFVPVPAA